MMKFTKRLTQLFKFSEYSKHAAILAFGTGVSQLILVISSPILTRLYPPGDFGIYALFFSLQSILSAFVTGKYEYTILVETDDNEAWHCVVLIISIATVAALLILFIGIGLQMFFFKGSNGYSIYFILMLSIASFLNGCYQALYYWFNRLQEYSILSSNRLYSAIALTVVSIMGGYLGWGANGLILGSLTGLLINTLFLMGRTLKARKISFNYITLKDKALKHLAYPKFLIPSGLLDRSAAQMHIVLFSSLFGSAVSGNLGLYQKVISVPVNLIGNSFANVFRQRASLDINSSRQCKALFERTAVKLLVMGFIPFAVLFFFAPNIFVHVFGSQWQDAGDYAQIMSWMFLFGFVVSPLSSLIYIGEKQKYDLLLQIFLVVMTSVSIFIGYQLKDVKLAIILYTISYCLKYFIEFQIAYSIAKKAS